MAVVGPGNFPFPDDIMSIAVAPAEDAELRDLLVGHGYQVDLFAEGWLNLFPLRFDLLPDGATHDVEVLCSFLVEELFIPAGESTCQHRLEEIILTNAVAMHEESKFTILSTLSKCGLQLAHCSRFSLLLQHHSQILLTHLHLEIQFVQFARSTSQVV